MRFDNGTAIFGSFAKEAGRTGWIIHNAGFLHEGINAVYKSFAVNDIAEAFKAARLLNFAGFSVSAPYKVNVLGYVDAFGDEIPHIWACNTVVRLGEAYAARNTDYLAAHEVLEPLKDKKMVILGYGGYAKAVHYAAQTLGMEVDVLRRKDLAQAADHRDVVVFNCTPVSDHPVHESCQFIDCVTSTPSGVRLAFLQATHQFKIYTGRPYPEPLKKLFLENNSLDPLIAWYTDRSGGR